MRYVLSVYSAIHSEDKKYYKVYTLEDENRVGGVIIKHWGRYSGGDLAGFVPRTHGRSKVLLCPEGIGNKASNIIENKRARGYDFKSSPCASGEDLDSLLNILFGSASCSDAVSIKETLGGLWVDVAVEIGDFFDFKPHRVEPESKAELGFGPNWGTW